MPLYRDPDFRRLPGALAAIFESGAQNSFFALPAWYALMAQHGVPSGTEVRLYTDERPSSATALLLQATPECPAPRLASLANAYTVEHGISCAAGADLATGLAAILSEVLAERPRWDRLSLTQLDPSDPSYSFAVRALRRAGLFVECAFHSGIWYEDTTALGFADYVAARPSELRNTWRRKRRKIERSSRLTKAFFADSTGIDQAIADYTTVYAASWKPAEFFPGFIPALIRLAAELGALRLGLYYIDRVPAAAQLWTFWNGRAVIHKLAHDRRYDDLSLGTILTMEMIERSLTVDRPREITLGRGDDPYKKLWLPKRRECWGITAANPQTWRGLRFGLEREAAKIYHRLRGEPVFPLS
jgi:Acetyltransferase (GNAT) domain